MFLPSKKIATDLIQIGCTFSLDLSQLSESVFLHTNTKIITIFDFRNK